MIKGDAVQAVFLRMFFRYSLRLYLFCFSPPFVFLIHVLDKRRKSMLSAITPKVPVMLEK